jgi:hypothetical protein
VVDGALKKRDPRIWWSTASTLLLLSSLLSLAVVPGQAQGKGSETRLRKLVFPGKISLGRVYSYDAPPNDRARAVIRFIKDCNVQFIGEAKGTLTISLRKSRGIYFEPSYELMEHPGSLNLLDPNICDCIAYSGIGLMGDAATTIPGLAHLTGLRRVDIKGAELTDEQLAPLKTLVNLESVDLMGNALTGACFEKLTCWTKLRSIDLSFNKLRPTSYHNLAQLKNLERIHLDQCGVTDSDLKELSTLPKLRDLAIGQASITSVGLAYLKNARSLKVLDICGTHLPAKDLVVLKDSTLHQLKVSVNMYSPSDLLQLKKAMPALNVTVPNTAARLSGEDKELFAPLH